MELKISVDCLENVKIDTLKFQKMLLLFNAIEDGWTLKKRKESYVFTKNHEGKKEILHESYLMKFMETNLEIKNIIS